MIIGSLPSILVNFWQAFGEPGATCWPRGEDRDLLPQIKSLETNRTNRTWLQQRSLIYNRKQNVTQDRIVVSGVPPRGASRKTVYKTPVFMRSSSIFHHRQVSYSARNYSLLKTSGSSTICCMLKQIDKWLPFHGC